MTDQYKQLITHQPLKIDLSLRSAGLYSVNSAKFGMVRNGGTKPHQGVDFACDNGYRTYAVGDGVCHVRETASYGKQVSLHVFGTPYYFFYAHLNRVDVTNGQEVKAGEVIGLTGETGNAKGMVTIDQGAHLHFEVRLKPWLGAGLDDRLDPLDFFEVNNA